MALFLGIVGLVCLLYFGLILFYSGIQTTFAFFWLVVGLVCLTASLAIFLQLRLPKIGRLSQELIYSKWKRQLLWVRVCIQTTVILALAVFLITEGLMIREIAAPVSENLDYIVVLGAKLSGNQLEPTMERCLEATLTYLEENPDTIVIVSGGDSSNSSLPQSRVMGYWLMAKGIPRSRILFEDRANSVQENILYSRELMEGENPTIGLVTMNFHTFRARAIAAKLGINAQTVPSKTDYVLQVNFMVREFLAIMKDKMIGNI